MKILFHFLLFVLIFTGCSSKQYFEPNHIEDDFGIEIKTIESKVTNYTSNGITLENYKLISKSGIIDLNQTEQFNFLNDNNSIISAADQNATLLIKKNDIINKYKFTKDIIAASVKDDLVALIFIDNSIALYDLNTKTIKFKEYFKQSPLNDIKIASPVFLSSVILYPTLDGKVGVFDIKSNSIVKTINIDPTSDINNIIFLSSHGDSLVAATNKKLFSFGNQKVNVQDFDIKNVLMDEKYIYISTLDGEIIKFDLDLNRIASKKFKFAKFYGIGSSTEYIYALESQDFLVRLNKNLEDEKVFDFSFDEDEKVQIVEDKLYFKDEYIILK